ncbi:hypothetical protein Tco_0665225 [Tanacetum coccineum]
MRMLFEHTCLFCRYGHVCVLQLPCWSVITEYLEKFMLKGTILEQKREFQRKSFTDPDRNTSGSQENRKVVGISNEERNGSKTIEVPARGKDVEYCLSVTPNVEIVISANRGVSGSIRSVLSIRCVCGLGLSKRRLSLALGVCVALLFIMVEGDNPPRGQGVASGLMGEVILISLILVAS